MQRLDDKLNEREIRSYLGGFNFSNEKVLQKVGSFSGGEKARLVLALLIWQKPNLILLDEPTNHLDLEMRLALNQALQDFAGSVILVSHDRYLLRSVCGDLWLVDAGEVQPFDSDIDGYPRWLITRKQRPSDRADVSRQRGANSKKQKRQAAAAKRLQQPKLIRIKQLEKEIEKLTHLNSDLESTLADPEIYDPGQKSLLTKTLADQAILKQNLQQMEDEWMMLGEALENS